MKVKDGIDGEFKYFKFMIKLYRIGIYVVYEILNFINIFLEYIMYIFLKNIFKMLKFEYYFYLNIRNDELLKYWFGNMLVLC